MRPSKAAAAEPAWPRGLLLALLVLAVYARVVLEAGFIIDDDLFVFKNPLLVEPGGLARIWTSTESPQYFPLLFTLHWLEARLWGLAPLGYHAASVLLHAANALLAWRLLKRLAVPGAWWAAALFALHPVQVESVAWIGKTNQLLSAFFCLLSADAYLTFDEGGDWRWYGAALGLFLAGLLSKTVACTLPAALALMLWLKGRRLGWKDLGLLVPFLGLGLALGLLVVGYEKHVVHQYERLWNLALPERAVLAGQALWFYLGKIIFPYPLTFNYPRWELDPSRWLQWAPSAAFLALLAVLWARRDSLGKGPCAAAAFFAATLSPVLGFFFFSAMYFIWVGDHYQYLACLGPLGLAGAGLARLEEPGGLGPRRARTLGAALLLVLGGLAWRQGGIYRDQESLWTDTLAKNPRSYMALQSLADLSLERRDFGRAAQYARRAAAAMPGHAPPHSALAAALAGAGDREGAVASYKNALALNPGEPGVAHNLARLLIPLGREEEAVALLRRALYFKPDFAVAHNDIAWALTRRGRLAEAAAEYRAALASDPDDAVALYNLAALSARLGRPREAVGLLERLTALHPDDAQSRRALEGLRAALRRAR